MEAHDEVCGMTIEADTAPATARFAGRRYYFCSVRCMRMFLEHPERFVPVSDEGGASGNAASASRSEA